MTDRQTESAKRVTDRLTGSGKLVKKRNSGQELVEALLGRDQLCGINILLSWDDIGAKILIFGKQKL